MSFSKDFEAFPKDVEVTDRLRLFMFFKALKIAGVVKGFGSAFNGSLLRRLQDRPDLRSETAFWDNPARNMSFVSDQNFRPNTHQIEAIVEELPKADIHPDQHDLVKEVFEHFLDRDFDTAPGADFALFRNKAAIERTGPDGQVRLDGDYLLYRVEQRKRYVELDGGNVDQGYVAEISVNFVRFFPHRKDGTRFMMLSLAAYNNQGDNRFLGARGWVDNLGKQMLATGRIVSRLGETIDREMDHGGMSTLVVEADNHAPFVVYRDVNTEQRHLVEAAPCLHLRALYNQKPSLSRGYLVRCRGVEDRGGKKGQRAAQRYKEIRALHKALGDWNKTDLELNAAATLLSMATGYPASAFHHVAEETGMPHGLLVNLPFARNPDQLPVNMPLMLPLNDAPLWQQAPRRLAADEICGIRIDLPEPPATG